MLGARSGWPRGAAARRVAFVLGCLALATAGAALARGSGWRSASLPGKAPGLPTVGALASVSCQGQHCVIVGQDPKGKAAVSLISTDGGTSWGHESAPPGASALYAVSCVSATRCWAVGKTGSSKAAIDKTSNGGRTWVAQTVPTAGALSAVSCSDSTCVASGAPLGSRVLVTHNGGGKWSGHNLGPCHGLCPGYQVNTVNFASPTVAYAAGGSRCGGRHVTQCPAAIWKSTDGAKQWRFVYKGYPYVDAISCIDTQHCWAAAANFKTGVILGSASGGAHWRRQTLPKFSGYFNAISCVLAAGQDRCVAVGENSNGTAGVIATTANGGSSWHLAHAPSGIGALYGVDSSATVDRAVGWTKNGTGPIALVS